jgi:NAD(P)-dependent dehydrogenase (short-subunit alcohol dehydrogenase family)
MAEQKQKQQPPQQQTPPGHEAQLTPQADHGETSYVGHGRLAGKAAVITGGDSGIGRAVAQLLAEKGIRVNSVAPGPIWTPLIPSTMPPDQVTSFGQQVPMKRPGQPVEVAPVYVMLASDEASYISGARIPVTGGTPIL